MTKEKRNVGRPRKLDKLKKSEKIFINMTEEEKNKLIKKSEEQDVSLSYICLQALRKAGYL